MKTRGGNASRSSQQKRNALVNRVDAATLEPEGVEAFNATMNRLRRLSPALAASVLVNCTGALIVNSALEGQEFEAAEALNQAVISSLKTNGCDFPRNDRTHRLDAGGTKENSITALTDRTIKIMEAHLEAIGDHDPRDFSAADLFPEIARDVPGVTHAEIVTALQQTADQAQELARKLIVKITERHAKIPLQLIICASDRNALAIAYAQGWEAGCKLASDDVPLIYQSLDRATEAAAWFHGHVHGAAWCKAMKYAPPGSAQKRFGFLRTG
jgi:hypothetical protein